MPGLSTFAVAILSGTGMAGLIIGFALKDIAENFMSSLLLNIQKPFCLGDVIEVNGNLGVAKQVTVRIPLQGKAEEKDSIATQTPTRKAHEMHNAPVINSVIAITVGSGTCVLITKSRRETARKNANKPIRYYSMATVLWLDVGINWRAYCCSPYCMYQINAEPV